MSYVQLCSEARVHRAAASLFAALVGGGPPPGSGATVLSRCGSRSEESAVAFAIDAIAVSPLSPRWWRGSVRRRTVPQRKRRQRRCD